MDPRAYLAIEGAITKRLWSAWRPYATTLFQQTAKAVEDGKFDQAYDLARNVDLTDIAIQNREWIKYHLLDAALFGARMANPTGPLMLSAGKYEQTLNRVVDLMSQGIEYGATLQLHDKLTDLVSNAEQLHFAPKVEKRQTYLQGYTSFKDTGDAALQLQSSLHSSRLAVWGFTAEAESVGVSTYRIQAVLDGRTCPYCTYINGREFKVADARSRVTQALGAADPMALKDIQPWPDQSAAGMAEIMGMTDQEISDRGYAIPPFHPNDRCILVLSDYQQPTKTPTVAMSAFDPLPSNPSTADTFTEMGEDLDPSQVDFWNSNVGVNPVQVMAGLTGDDPSQYLKDHADEHNIYVHDDGTVEFHQEDDGTEVSQTYDPVSKEVTVNYVDVSQGTADQAADTALSTLDRTITTAGALGAAAVLMAVSGGDSVYASAVSGFVPDSAADWFDLKNDILADLSVGADLGGVLPALQPYQQQALMDILNSNDEFAVLALVALPYTVFGLPIGQVLLHGRGTTMRFDLLDDYQRAVFLDDDDLSEDA